MITDNAADVQVTATVFAVILGGTESILGISLQNGFRFEKVNLLESSFKDKYINSKGQVINQYCFSQLEPSSQENISFICLTKYDTFTCPTEAFSIGEMRDAKIFKSVIEEWQEKQETFIREILLMLRIYKDGNIEIPNVQYQYISEYKPFEVTLKQQQNYECQHADSGDVYTDFYTVNEIEIAELNAIIANNTYLIDFYDNVYDKFELGCTVFRDEVAFGELITVGEVLFLNYNNNDKNAKKEKLANRMSVWIADTPQDIQHIHDNIIDFYKFRSDDTHEAKNDSITSSNRKILREYIRTAIKKYIARITAERFTNSTKSINEIRKSIVLEIKNDVITYKENGLLC